MLGKVIAAVSAVLLILVIATTSAVTQKSTLTWPVGAPTRVAARQPDYAATGWTISSPFGGRPDPERPGQWELHEGVDLAGLMFCMDCSAPPLGDVAVAHVGWDQEWGTDPLHSGVGVVVDMDLQHPEEAGAIRIRYGHLQPYHVYVRTRSCTQTVDCPDYHTDSAGSVTITCPGQVVRTGRSHGTRAYAYATPGDCTVSVSWPPNYLPQGETTIHFDQRIAPGVASSDAAITFNAQIPPPPPPVPLTPTPGSDGRGALDCSPQPLVFLDGVTNQGGGAAYNKLIAPAAASFQAVRQEVLARTGLDALAILGDVLRHPSFTTTKAGVANYSWHKAGRAVDLNQGGPFQVRAEGSVFRLFIGDVDITAIFLAHGWNRIPAQGATLEWWHDEYHPDNIAWASAMLQVWPVSTLQAVFPEINWAAVGCTTGGLPPGDGEAETTGCVPDPPRWTDSGVGYGHGCGPPVLPPDAQHATGTHLRQFTGIVGWLGDSGHLWPPAPAGIHLHLGLDVGTTTDVCRWPYQVGHTPPGEPPPGGTQCLTTWADPLQFLPQANQDTLRMVAGTPVPAAAGQAGDPTYDSALVQLPPPGHPAGLLLPPAKPDQPAGTWWSPGNDDRANNARCPLGGPAADDWLTWIAALLFPWLFGC